MKTTRVNFSCWQQIVRSHWANSLPGLRLVSQQGGSIWIRTSMEAQTCGCLMHVKLARLTFQNITLEAGRPPRHACKGAGAQGPRSWVRGLARGDYRALGPRLGTSMPLWRSNPFRVHTCSMQQTGESLRHLAVTLLMQSSASTPMDKIFLEPFCRSGCNGHC